MNIVGDPYTIYKLRRSNNNTERVEDPMYISRGKGRSFRVATLTVADWQAQNPALFYNVKQIGYLIIIIKRCMRSFNNKTKNVAIWQKNING